MDKQKRNKGPYSMDMDWNTFALGIVIGFAASLIAVLFMAKLK